MTALAKLAHISLRCIEQHALLILRSPHHLHLHDKLTAETVLATHIHYAVLFQRIERYQFGAQILHTLNLLLFVFKRQQRIEKADYQILMLAEHFLESQIGLRV